MKIMHKTKLGTVQLNRVGDRAMRDTFNWIRAGIHVAIIDDLQLRIAP